jgi:hypothetical protein
MIRNLYTTCDGLLFGLGDRERARKLLDLVLDCLQVDPNERLNAVELVERLENVSITTPPHDSKSMDWNNPNDIPNETEPIA